MALSGTDRIAAEGDFLGHPRGLTFLFTLFAREKEAFLRQFLKLEKGLPSHDTLPRVFRLLDPEQFSACFQSSWASFRKPAMASSP